MIAAAVDEVDVSVLTEMNRLKILRIKNGLFYFLYVKFVLVPLQAHHHNQPVVIIITRMKRPINVCDWNGVMISLTLNIVRDILNQICRMIDQETRKHQEIALQSSLVMFIRRNTISGQRTKPQGS